MKLSTIVLCGMLQFSIAVLCMEVGIRLDDGTICILTPNEIEASSVLLQKQLLRDKTTSEHIEKWGYDKALHVHLKKAPLYVNDISPLAFQCFKEALSVEPTQFSSYFKQLTPEQQEVLCDVSSYKKLGVPQLITQISEQMLVPELVRSVIMPHFFAKDIVDHMRNNIIICNAQNNNFTQNKEAISGDDIQTLFSTTFDAFMFLPKFLIKKNNNYIFDGCVGRVTAELEGQKWTRVIEYKRAGDIRYVITPDITDEECAKQEIKRFSNNKSILWTIDDSSNTVICKQNIECGGGFQDRRFSSNGCYLAITTHATDTCPSNTLELKKLGIQSNGNDFHDVISRSTDREILSLCFNAQSTVLAAGSWGNETENVITIWDAQNGTLLTDLSGHNGVVNVIQFNHRGDRMLTASYKRTILGIFVLTIILWDTIDSKNIKVIKKHHMMSGDFIRHCCFNADDTRVVISLKNGDLVFFDGISGDPIKQQSRNASQESLVSSVFSRNGRFLVSTLLAQDTEHTDNTLLYDMSDGTLLATVLENQVEMCGVGFTSDGRHIVTLASMGQGEHCIITTTLFDEESDAILKWLKKESSFIQKYALYRAYCAQKEGISQEASKAFLMQMMCSKTKESEKLKQLLERHL